MKKKQIWTIGHSTRSLEEFTEVLQSFRIAMVTDIRSLPGSRKYPHFNKEALEASLASEGISYKHLKSLGGRRKPQPDSVNTGWKNTSFRAYADYMATEEFTAGMQELIGYAQDQRVAYMCAEAVWWRCHRALVSDWLKHRGWEVIHIFNPTKSQIHPYTSVAKIQDDTLEYH